MRVAWCAVREHEASVVASGGAAPHLQCALLRGSILYYNCCPVQMTNLKRSMVVCDGGSSFI